MTTTVCIVDDSNCSQKHVWHLEIMPNSLTFGVLKNKLKMKKYKFTAKANYGTTFHL